MLVLSRKMGEVLIIGDARIVFSPEGGRCKVAIDAPKHITIMREELLTNGRQDKSVYERRASNRGTDDIATDDGRIERRLP